MPPFPSRSLIIGGTEVSTTDWPSYAASFAWTGIGGGGWGCGGALIRPDIVLTAAHCQWVYQNHGAWIGASQITGEDATFWPTAELLIHPDYTDQQLVHNDIMLVKLDGRVPHVNELYYYNNDPNFPEDGDAIRVIGFGTTQEGGAVSNTLRQVDIEYVDSETCQTTWPQLNYSLQLCAGTTEGGRDACDSDSGSPLFVVDNDRIIQVGIVGDGIGCARAGVPSLNTRISTYADWIHDTICKVSSHPPRTCEMNRTWWNMASVAPSDAVSMRSLLSSHLVVIPLLLVVALFGLYGRQWNNMRRRKGYQTVSSEVLVEARLTV